MNRLLYIPEQHPGLPWVIIDADRSDYGVPSLEKIIDMEGIISAPWASNGALMPICFHIALTFEGIKNDEGTPTGVFSIIVQPKDAAILRALTQRVGEASSPRDLLKKVVATLSKTQMYPGARLDLIGAHYGARGGKRLFMGCSATTGWPILHGRHSARILRAERQWRSRGLLRQLSDYVLGVSAPVFDQLSSEPPFDPWKVRETSDLIDEMMMGMGLEAGPLKMAGESLFRKIARDPRLCRVMRPFERGGGTVFGGQSSELPKQEGRSTFTIVQIE